MFKNIHGQEPSLSLPDDHQQHSEFIQRMGHEPVDIERCQGPVYEGIEPTRCTNPAICVMVENQPRPNGLIAAMGLCGMHRDSMLRTHGADYAYVTPLEAKS